MTEQLPDPANRVTLAREKDALGLPRPRIQYRIGTYTMDGLREERKLHERLFNALGVSEIHHWPGPQ